MSRQRPDRPIKRNERNNPDNIFVRIDSGQYKYEYIPEYLRDSEEEISFDKLRAERRERFYRDCLVHCGIYGDHPFLRMMMMIAGTNAYTWTERAENFIAMLPLFDYYHGIDLDVTDVTPFTPMTFDSFLPDRYDYPDNNVRSRVKLPRRSEVDGASRTNNKRSEVFLKAKEEVKDNSSNITDLYPSE